MFLRSVEQRWSGASLRLRFTVLFALVTSAAMALLGLSLHLSLSAQLDLREREELLGKLTQFRHLLTEVPDRATIAAEAARFNDVLVGHESMRADVMDHSGAPLVRISGFSWPMDLVTRAAERGEAAEVVETHDGRFHLILASAPIGQKKESAVVGVAHDRAETLLLLSRFRASVLVAVILGTLLAGGLGYAAALRGLAPVRKMVETAGRIRAEKLGERLDTAAVPEELRELALSFNDMLARLEESFRRLSQFSDDLAHELRTPIGNLMLHSQVALERPREAAELREVLHSGLEELQRLSRMVNDMLFLAKADNAQIALRREQIVLEDEVEKVLEFFEPLASEKAIKLVRRGCGRLEADRGMLRRLLANLVSNAVRYGTGGSTVEVRVGEQPQGAEICVVNEGASLSGEERRRIFDRFYRSSASRSDSGAGLGLAIVKSIVELHGGSASVLSEGGRNAFSVTLNRAR